MGKRAPLDAADDLTPGAATPSSTPVHAVNGVSAPSSGASTPSGVSPTVVSTSSLNAPPSVSAVWAYFEKDAAGNSICKFCDRVIKGHHSSNLLSHLRTAGRTDAVHQQASAICEEHRENKRNIKRQKMAIPTAAEFAANYPHLVAAAAAAAVPAFGAPFSFKKDNPLFPSSASALAAAAAAASLTRDQRDAIGVITPQPHAFTPDQLTQDFTLMVLVDNLPLNYASQPGFQNLSTLFMGDKKAELPDEEAVLKTIGMLHQSLTLTTKMLLSRAKAVGISLETWKHPSPGLTTFAQYLVVNAHFSINFRDYHVAISCTPVGNGIDTESLRAILEQTFERVGIKDKIIACVVGDLPWKEGAAITITNTDLPCGFTPINIDGRLATPETQRTTVIASAASLLRQTLKKDVFMASFPHVVISIDAFLRRLTARTETTATLKRKYPHLDPDSTAAEVMFVSYYDYLRVLQDALADLEQLAQDYQIEFLPNSTVEWVNYVIKKLRPFVRYADAFEGEKQKKSGSDREVHKDGLSSVSTIAAALLTYVDKLTTSVDDSTSSSEVDPQLWKSFFDSVAKEIRAQFGSNPPLSVAATLLDPRYKAREYCYVVPEVDRSEAEALLRRLFLWSGDDAVSSRQNSGDLDKTPSKAIGSSDDEDEDEDLLAHLPSTTPKEAVSDDNELTVTWAKELSAFLSLPLAERNVDPLSWWKASQLRFPLLASYAEVLMALPAAGSTGETMMKSISQVLLRTDGASQDPLVATNPVLVEAFLLFQKNREYVVEWFRSTATVVADPSIVSEVEAASSFKHIENV
ncbi:hypothetical protein Poli38472_005777 [Pythium oligandrum]|uniref:BED-type domain-containing protein n=1 Tax=Pythium oligandrum TaxID=41045 RepID=A0A8K1FPF0_PYTOL|nr:hypothetical protein Poli38472_005777 [Pythium oligandrum]|eukprot:TMW68309.1 hypothetical protein Poli38472_005777 [Pythium oligandrum]